MPSCLGSRLRWLPGVLLALVSSASGAGEPTPQILRDGGVRLPEFSAPPSVYLSEAGRTRLIEAMRGATGGAPVAEVAERRWQYDRAIVEPRLARAKQLYPVRIEASTMAGVPVASVEPAGGIAPANRHRVLINLHGGGFQVGGGAGGLLESIPVASVAGIRVLALDFRQGPEHKFPAASEDVAGVYRELLKTHAPRDIGIYGCSSGGWLTAMAVAWFQKHALPSPGAIAILCSGGSYPDGESSYTAQALMGSVPVAPTASRPPIAYLSEARLDDPLVSPALHPEILAKFPPTLFITGTRDKAMSSALFMHARLVRAGVLAELHIWDGTWHASTYDADIPESREAFQLMAKFFQTPLAP
jgi:monoterpene epsilon-lactone hydrolase